ncbi:MAG: 50S ribosomal protein L32 [Minisyncoccota bacterium]
MANPKQRHTRHRRDRARKQYDVALVNTTECPQCKAQKLAHRVCPTCGIYKGMQMVDTAPKLKNSQKTVK